MAVLYLSFEERKMIEELIKKGATFPQIGVSINRSKNTVRNEVRKLGSREIYSAKKAQHLADTADERRRNSLRKWIDGNKPKVTMATIKKRSNRLSERITILEQKVDILTTLLKEGNNAIN